MKIHARLAGLLATIKMRWMYDNSWQTLESTAWDKDEDYV